MLPKLVMFDYGETLAHEDDFRPLDGFAAMLPHALENPESVSAEALLLEYREAYFEKRRQCHALDIELPNLHRWQLLFGKYRLKFSLPPQALETLFWDAAAPCVPTPNVPELLALLREKGVKTGVISNMGFTGDALRSRLERLFPQHRFDFILSSADVLLRKPNPRLFELGLRLADCRAEESWFMGDNLRCDVAGAASAGIFPVHYDRDLGCVYRVAEYPEVVPDHLRVEDWSEIIERFK